MSSINKYTYCLNCIMFSLMKPFCIIVSSFKMTFNQYNAELKLLTSHISPSTNVYDCVKK